MDFMDQRCESNIFYFFLLLKIIIFRKCVYSENKAHLSEKMKKNLFDKKNVIYKMDIKLDVNWFVIIIVGTKKI